MKISKLLAVVVAHACICSQTTAEVLLTIPKPTQIVVEKNSKGISLSLPGIIESCTYTFLAEGNRGIIDCAGRYPQFSKTIPVKANSFVKQLRIGIHPDKLRIVMDLIEPIPHAITSKKNYFSFSSSANTSGIPPVKPTVVDIDVRSINKHLKESVKQEATKPQKIEGEIQLIDKPTIVTQELPLSVETLKISFTEGERLIKDLVVTNTSTSLLSISVDCYPESGLLENSNNTLEAVHEILSASPKRFTLGPNQKRSLRFILSLGNSNTEKTQELKFIARFSNGEGDEIAPKVSFNYLPRSALPDLVATPLNGKIKLSNAGNASVELSSGRCCRSGDCQAVNINKLAAKASVVLDVPEDCQLEFVSQYQGAFQKFQVRKEILNEASH